MRTPLEDPALSQVGPASACRGISSDMPRACANRPRSKRPEAIALFVYRIVT